MFDLYILNTCPYCKKVMDYFDSNKIEYKTFDIDDSINYDRLISLGGKEQVPFLYDKKNNVKMYESSSIIEYAADMQG